MEVKILYLKIIYNYFFYQVYSAEGHVTFTSTIAGEHQLCMRSNTSAGWFGRSSMFVSWSFCFLILNIFFFISFSNVPSM